MSNQVYTANRGVVFLPDVQIKELKASYTYEALRGYGFVLAVFDGETPIGHTTSDALGYPTAKAWLEAQGPKS